MAPRGVAATRPRNIHVAMRRRRDSSKEYPRSAPQRRRDRPPARPPPRVHETTAARAKPLPRGKRRGDDGLDAPEEAAPHARDVTVRLALLGGRHDDVPADDDPILGLTSCSFLQRWKGVILLMRC